MWRSYCSGGSVGSLKTLGVKLIIQQAIGAE